MSAAEGRRGLEYEDGGGEEDDGDREEVPYVCLREWAAPNRF